MFPIEIVTLSYHTISERKTDLKKFKFKKNFI